jgi:protein-tyrosine phosphatase
MIDLHCHILPGLDDGPSEMVESLQMADIAVRDGITAIVATPHAYPDVFFPRAEEVEQAGRRLREGLQAQGLKVAIGIGRDAHLVPELLGNLNAGRVQTLNGSRFVLTEPPEFFTGADLQDQLFHLRQGGYVPVITHPERYAMFVEDPMLVQTLVAQGNIFQVTAGSLMGRFGHEALDFSRWMAVHRLIHVVASDAHGPRHRAPVLREAYRVLEDWVGAGDAAVIRDNARAIWENRELAPLAPAGRDRGFFHRLKLRFRQPPGRRRGTGSVDKG